LAAAETAAKNAATQAFNPFNTSAKMQNYMNFQRSEKGKAAMKMGFGTAQVGGLGYGVTWIGDTQTDFYKKMLGKFGGIDLSTVEGLEKLKEQAKQNKLSWSQRKALGISTESDRIGLGERLDPAIAAAKQYKSAKDYQYLIGVGHQFTLDMASETTGGKKSAADAQAVLDRTRTFIAGGMQGPITKDIGEMLAKNYGGMAGDYTKSKDLTSLITNRAVSSTAAKQRKTIEDNLLLLNQAAAAPGGLLNAKDIQVWDGEGKGLKKITGSEASRMKKDLDEQRSALLQSQQIMSERETAQGKTIATQVNPPVLNYWNNQWTL
jgi:hypothetical protein